MKKPLIFIGLFLVSAGLYAQEVDSLIGNDTVPQTFNLEPLKSDSLSFSLSPGAIREVLLSRNSMKGTNEVVFVDPNMKILEMSKSFSGKIKVVEIPADYFSRMPIVKLKESNDKAAIISPKK
ncbi:hypothetical protein IFO69_06700 [Echinicola sp. CAU 1574]|uniref:DUF4138 domain-containing protein n=1 Tax=Echinicola arenosa TaxID=2774144 RepID=A0ABR9AJC3_9BACT|nr:hypothetical protein [Echinicola arenosa]MBD8488432.1 hypothetical protein [Echinicola arenosa]